MRVVADWSCYLTSIGVTAVQWLRFVFAQSLLMSVCFFLLLLLNTSVLDVLQCYCCLVARICFVYVCPGSYPSQSMLAHFAVLTRSALSVAMFALLC